MKIVIILLGILSMAMTDVKQKMVDELRAKGIKDPKAIANVLAQYEAESSFKTDAVEEPNKYSTSWLLKTFGPGQSKNTVRFKSAEEIEALKAQGPDAVAEKLYGGRLGNAKGEGYKYRGRGLVQLSGKANYADYSQKLFGDDRLVKNPDLATDPEVSVKIAAQYIKDRSNRFDLSDIEQATKAVGPAGAEAVAKRKSIAEALLPEIQAEKAISPQPIKAEPSKDYSDFPFKEAFDMARARGDKLFKWEGKLFHTKTKEELASPKPLPAKDGGVEDIFGGPIETPAQRASRVGIEKQAEEDLAADIAETKKAFEKPEAKDPFADIGLGEVSRTPDGKSKISNILKKTTNQDYDTMGFGEAFAKAKKKGEKEFTWKGRPYHTKYSEEM
jgi:predicted chitinase